MIVFTEIVDNDVPQSYVDHKTLLSEFKACVIFANQQEIQSLEAMIACEVAAKTEAIS